MLLNHTITLSVALILSASYLIIGIDQVLASRYGLRSEDLEELSVKEAINNYRVALADPNLYYLASAGLLNDSNISDELLDDGKQQQNEVGEFVKYHFEFNSGEILRKIVLPVWLITVQETLSLHVYDDPQDVVLAKGPNVNQELCGLHLDYMLHLIEKFNANSLMETREYSIFKIMNSFDAPILGLARGNKLHLGDYLQCTMTQLNIMKDELINVDRKAAKKYFSTPLIEEGEANEQSKFKRLLQSIWTNIRPFFGFRYKQNQLNLAQFSEQVRTQPMRYCLAGLRWPNWPNSSFYKRNFVMRTAACLPTTCDSSSLDLYYDKILKLTEFQMPNHALGYYIQDLYCLPDEKSELRNPMNYKSTVLFILFNICWFLLLILATIIRCFTADKSNSGVVKSWERSTWWSYLNCWCLTKNFQDFIAAKKGDQDSETKTTRNNTTKVVKIGRDEKTIKDNELIDDNNNNNSKLDDERRYIVDLNPLEGYKVIASILIMLSHYIILTGSNTWNLDHSKEVIENSWLSMIVLIGQSTVDNFYAVTGLISVKIILKTVPHKLLLKPGFWVKYSLYRYLRIIPLYLFVHVFLNSANRFIGSGPLWDYGTSHTGWANVCQQESWLNVILLRANLKSPSHHCDPVGWYLANDIQFTFIIPFIVILYLKRPIYGYLAILIGTLVTMANHVAYYYHAATEDPRMLVEITPLCFTTITGHLSSGYVHVQHRCASFLAGVLAGLLLDQYEQGRFKRGLSKGFVRGLKVAICLYIYILAFAPFFLQMLPLNNKQFILIVGSILHSTFHGLSALFASGFLLLLCTGQFPNLNRILSNHVFRPLSNTLLSLLIVHIPFIIYRNNTLHRLDQISVYYFITGTITMTVESYILAVVIHLIYELPMRKSIVKLMLFILNASSTKSTRQHSENLNNGNKVKGN